MLLYLRLIWQHDISTVDMIAWCDIHS